MSNYRVTVRPCCGLTRTLPANTQVGDSFDLVPCPRCGATFHGQLVAPDLIEQLDPRAVPETPHACA